MSGSIWQYFAVLKLFDYLLTGGGSLDTIGISRGDLAPKNRKDCIAGIFTNQIQIRILYSWKRLQIYPDIKLPSIHRFGSKYSWKNFLGFLTDDAITKSRKKYIVGIFSTRIQIR